MCLVETTAKIAAELEQQKAEQEMLSAEAARAQRFEQERLAAKESAKMKADGKLVGRIIWLCIVVSDIFYWPLQHPSCFFIYRTLHEATAKQLADSKARKEEQEAVKQAAKDATLKLEAEAAGLLAQVIVSHAY